MEHSQRMRSLAPVPWCMEPHETRRANSENRCRTFRRRGVLSAIHSAHRPRCRHHPCSAYHYFPARTPWLPPPLTRSGPRSPGEQHENPEEALRNALRTYFLS